MKRLTSVVSKLLFVVLSLAAYQSCAPLESMQYKGSLSQSQDFEASMYDKASEVSKFAMQDDPQKCFLESIALLEWSNASDFDDQNSGLKEIIYSPYVITAIAIAKEDSKIVSEANLQGWKIKPIRKKMDELQSITDIVIEKLSDSSEDQLDCLVGTNGNLQLLKDIGGDGKPVSLIGHLNDTSKILACKITRGDLKLNIQSDDRRTLSVSAAKPIVFKRGCNVEYERERLLALQPAPDEQVAQKAMQYTKSLGLGEKLTASLSSASTAPGQPKISNVLVGNASAQISFTAPSSTGGSPITGYEIYINNNTYSSGTTSSSPITMTGLVNDSIYKFRIAAKNINGTGTLSDFSSAVTPSMSLGPAPPTKVSAQAESGTQDEFYSTKILFDLPQNYLLSKVTGFEVYGQDGKLVATGKSSPITVTYSDLANKVVQSSGTLYSYTVKSISASGASLSTNPVSAITAPGKVLIYPTNITGPQQGVVLSAYTWPGYTGDQSLSALIRFKRKPFYSGEPRPEDPVRPDDYGVSSLKSDWYCPSLPYLYVSDVNKKYEVTYPNLKMGCNISLYVVANRATAYDQYHQIVARISSASSEASNPVVFVPIPPPASPKIKDVIEGDKSLTVTFTPIRNGWDDNGQSPLLKWELLGNDKVIAEKPYAANQIIESIQAVGLENGVQYQLKVRAVNAIGPGVMDPKFFAGTPNGPPMAPTNVSGAPGDKQITLQFKEPVAGTLPEKYEIFSGLTFMKTFIPTWPRRSGFQTVVLDGLVNGTEYKLKVRGIYKNLPGEFSSPVVHVTPKLIAPNISFSSSSYVLSTKLVISAPSAPIGNFPLYMNSTNTGGFATSCTSSIDLGSIGLGFANDGTCSIIGTVSVDMMDPKVFTITATNSAGSKSVDLTISVLGCKVSTEFATVLDNQTVRLNIQSKGVQRIALFCRELSNPPPEYGFYMVDTAGAYIVNNPAFDVGALPAGNYECTTSANTNQTMLSGNIGTRCNLNEPVRVQSIPAGCPAGTATFNSLPNAEGKLNVCAAKWDAKASGQIVASVTGNGTASAFCNGTTKQFEQISTSCPVLPTVAEQQLSAKAKALTVSKMASAEASVRSYCPGGLISRFSEMNAAGQRQQCLVMWGATAPGLNVRQSPGFYESAGFNFNGTCSDSGEIIENPVAICPVPSIQLVEAAVIETVEYPFNGTEPPPSPVPNISFSSNSFSLLRGSAMSAISPNNSGGAITNCRVVPALPAGLSLNISTCEISGTPTTGQNALNYTITPSNSAGAGVAKSISLAVHYCTVTLKDSSPFLTTQDILVSIKSSGVRTVSQSCNSATPLPFLDPVSLQPVVDTGTGYFNIGKLPASEYSCALTAQPTLESAAAINCTAPNPIVFRVSTTTTAPGAPIIGTAVAGDAKATVHFTAPTSDGGSPITSYEVYANNETSPRKTGSSSPITVTGLTNGTSYTFKVKARNAINLGVASGASNAVTPSAAPTAPGAPTIGTAVAGDASATVNFTAPNSDGGSPITSYEVYANNETSPRKTGAASPIVVNGLTNGTSYTFKVKARNAINIGSASGASNAVTPSAAPTAPGAPIIGTAVAGDASATVNFTAPNSDGGSPITSYEVYANNETTPRKTGSSSPITVTGLTNGTSYTFKVKARNAINLGVASGASNSVTPKPAHTNAVYNCTVVNSSVTNFSVNGEIIADSNHFDFSGRYFVAGYDPNTATWWSFDGAVWYPGGADATNLKSIAGFTRIDATGMRGIILANENMTAFRGATIYIGYGIGSSDASAADYMIGNNLYKTCTTIP